MFNQITVVAEAFGRNLAETYRHYYGDRKPQYATALDSGARLLIEQIGTSDALYHNTEHTILVTLVGQDILRGKLLRHAVSPEDWLHFMFALLCHDIGYIRGICSADETNEMIISENGERFQIPRGASDAVLTPYHVNRGKIFVRERCALEENLDGDRLAAAIELTRFPVPEDDDHKETDTEPGLVRAADLIGQLADPRYPQKLNALYYEFVENGTAQKLDISSPADLVETYPKFYWAAVEPYIGDATKYLNLTTEGKQWIAHLYSHVFKFENLKLS